MSENSATVSLSLSLSRIRSLSAVCATVQHTTWSFLSGMSCLALRSSKFELSWNFSLHWKREKIWIDRGATAIQLRFYTVSLSPQARDFMVACLASFFPNPLDRLVIQLLFLHENLNLASSYLTGKHFTSLLLISNRYGEFGCMNMIELIWFKTKGKKNENFFWRTLYFDKKNYMYSS